MIDMYPFRNAVTVSHMMTEPYARQAHVLVDMTCGNGHDTAFLARTMPDDAVLYAFDIQPCAIERTRQRLQDEGLGDKDVRCRCGSYFSPQISLIRSAPACAAASATPLL